MAISTKLENQLFIPLNNRIANIEAATLPYVGVAPYPTTPTIGTRWVELDAGNNLVMDWLWNGTYWLSSQIYSHFFTTAQVNTVANVAYPTYPQFNVFLLDIIATIRCTVAGTATTNWGWNVARINTFGVATVLASGNNIGGISNTWQVYQTPINLHIVTTDILAVSGLRLFEIRTGTIGKQGSIGFEYRRARI